MSDWAEKLLQLSDGANILRRIMSCLRQVLRVSSRSKISSGVSYQCVFDPVVVFHAQTALCVLDEVVCLQLLPLGVSEEQRMWVIPEAQKVLKPLLF